MEVMLGDVGVGVGVGVGESWEVFQTNANLPVVDGLLGGGYK